MRVKERTKKRVYSWELKRDITVKSWNKATLLAPYITVGLRRGGAISS